MSKVSNPLVILDELLKEHAIVITNVGHTYIAFDVGPMKDGRIPKPESLTLICTFTTIEELADKLSTFLDSHYT